MSSVDFCGVIIPLGLAILLQGSRISMLRDRLEQLDKRTSLPFLPPCEICGQPACVLKATIEGGGELHQAKLCAECFAEAMAADVRERSHDNEE